MLVMAKTSSPARHFLMSDAFVAVDTRCLELEVDERVGRNGQQGDQAGNEGIAWNADEIRTTFSGEAFIDSEIDAEKNDNGDDVEGEYDLRDAEGRPAWMSHDAGDDLDGAFECRSPEENPCRIYDDEGYCTPKNVYNRRFGFVLLAEEHDMGEIEDTMDGSPDDECPVGTMPEAAQQEDDDLVADPFRFGDAIATKRDVEIVTEPGGQGDMPPFPEVWY